MRNLYNSDPRAHLENCATKKDSPRVLPMAQCGLGVHHYWSRGPWKPDDHNIVYNPGGIPGCWNLEDIINPAHWIFSWNRYLSTQSINYYLVDNYRRSSALPAAGGVNLNPLAAMPWCLCSSLSLVFFILILPVAPLSLVSPFLSEYGCFWLSTTNPDGQKVSFHSFFHSSLNLRSFLWKTL